MKKNTVTELMMQIESLLSPIRQPFVLDGWCDVEKAQALASIIIGLRPKVTVEIGVFGGRSLIPMAMAHAFTGNGVAIGIDPWEKQCSLNGMTGENAQWWANVDHEAIYQQFLRAANRQIVEGWLNVVRQDSDTYALRPDGPKVIDLLHIDGNHGPQAVNDVNLYATRIRAGGILIMDDVDWAAEAVTRVRDLNFNFLYPLGTGAVFQK